MFEAPDAGLHEGGRCRGVGEHIVKEPTARHHLLIIGLLHHAATHMDELEPQQQQCRGPLTARVK